MSARPASRAPAARAAANRPPASGSSRSQVPSGPPAGPPRGRLRRVAGTLKAISPSKWSALARAAPWVLTTRVALGVVPWKRLSAAMETAGEGGADRPPDLERARDTIWAVHALSRRLLPDRPCLTQALVARRLLRDCGVNATLRMGAVRRPGGDIGAHAWLERDGQVILGWTGVEYAPFERRRPAQASDAAKP